MPKYMIQGSYSPEGLKGLAKETASGRKAAVQATLKSVKAKLECYYFTFGTDDFVIIVDAPDNVAMAAIALAVGATGLVDSRVTALLSIDEVDQALALPTKFRGPGQGS